MKLFTCKCKWTFVLGKKTFYGPIFQNGSTSAARIQPRQNFADVYEDCYTHWLNRNYPKAG